MGKKNKSQGVSLRVGSVAIQSAGDRVQGIIGIMANTQISGQKIASDGFFRCLRLLAKKAKKVEKIVAQQIASDLEGERLAAEVQKSREKTRRKEIKRQAREDRAAQLATGDLERQVNDLKIDLRDTARECQEGRAELVDSVNDLKIDLRDVALRE